MIAVHWKQQDELLTPVSFCVKCQYLSVAAVARMNVLAIIDACVHVA